MGIRILILLIILSCFLSLSYPESCESINHGNPKLIDFSFNRKKITAKTGDEIQIGLETMGGTGYSWYADELDRNFLQILEEGTKTVGRETERIGGNPVVMFWRLKVLKTGITTLKMNYYRIWEGKDKAIKHFEIEIHIVPS